MSGLRLIYIIYNPTRFKCTKAAAGFKRPNKNFNYVVYDYEIIKKYSSDEKNYIARGILSFLFFNPRKNSIFSLCDIVVNKNTK